MPDSVISTMLVMSRWNTPGSNQAMIGISTRPISAVKISSTMTSASLK